MNVGIAIKPAIRGVCGKRRQSIHTRSSNAEIEIKTKWYIEGALPLYIKKKMKLKPESNFI